MASQFSRTELILEGAQKLHSATVAVFGVGGVGSYAVEALARAGVGNFILIDNDTICLTNINRQIHAMHSTIGQLKVDAMKNRVSDINPAAIVYTHSVFVTPQNIDELLFDVRGSTDEKAMHTDEAERGNSAAQSIPMNNAPATPLRIDYIIDAVDNVTAKIAIAVRAKQIGVPVISAMGAGNKLHPEMMEIQDIYKTSVCPLARVMRKELRDRGINSLKVVYSKEMPLTPQECDDSCPMWCNCQKKDVAPAVQRNSIPGSVSFVPSVAGLIMAGEVVRSLASA